MHLVHKLDENGRYMTSREKIGNRKPVPSELMVKKVCDSCNNGWIADLEGQAKPIVMRLADGRAGSFDVGEQEILSRWMFKTALVYAFWDPEASPFTPNTYRRFFKSREVPATTLVWLTRSESQWADIAMHMNNLRGRFAGDLDEDERNNTCAMYVGVDGLALLLHYSRTLGPGFLTLLDPWDRGWIQIEPPTEGATWPREPVEERSLLSTINHLGSDEDLIPSVDTEGRTPAEVRSAGSSIFVDGLMTFGLDFADFHGPPDGPTVGLDLRCQRCSPRRGCRSSSLLPPWR